MLPIFSTIAPKYSNISDPVPSTGLGQSFKLQRQTQTYQ
jgi:hypothetical protein